jgi:hypothetical protein
MLHGNELVFLQLLVRLGGAMVVAGSVLSPSIQALVSEGYCALLRDEKEGKLLIALSKRGNDVVADLFCGRETV